jgi:hypothetical protein
MFDPDLCDYNSKDEFDDAWEQSFLDAHRYELLDKDELDKDDKDDEEFEKKPLTRECKCCTMRK